MFRFVKVAGSIKTFIKRASFVFIEWSMSTDVILLSANISFTYFSISQDYMREKSKQKSVPSFLLPKHFLALTSHTE